jgi:hypothetical protein
MPILRVTRSLEYGMFTVFDHGVREDLPAFDLNDDPVFVFGSTLCVAAQHEVDGDVLIQVVVGEDSDLLRTPEPRGGGLLHVPNGHLRLNTAAWVADDELEIAPGSYSTQVFTSPGDDPEFVSVVLELVP